MGIRDTLQKTRRTANEQFGGLALALLKIACAIPK